MKFEKLLSCLLILQASACFAQSSSGSHGGDAVPTDSAIRLRDLLDPGNCSWKSGSSILTANSKIGVILDNLKEVNPQLGYGLDDQIKKIRWCFTKTLKRIDTNDRESEKLTYFVDTFARNKIQAGIRVLNTVYVDKTIITPEPSPSRMALGDQPYFYIHEAMHAFLDEDVTNRNRKVRDVVRAIRMLQTNEINIEDFDATLEGCDVNVIASTNKIQNYFRILFNQTLPPSEILLLAKTYPEKAQLEDLNAQCELADKTFTKDQFQTLRDLTGMAKFDVFKKMYRNCDKVFISDMQPAGRCGKTFRQSSNGLTDFSVAYLTNLDTQTVVSSTDQLWFSPSPFLFSEACDEKR